MASRTDARSKRGETRMATGKERAAWKEYLRRTRYLFGANYVEVEEWAWTELQIRLAREVGE